MPINTIKIVYVKIDPLIKQRIKFLKRTITLLSITHAVWWMVGGWVVATQ